MHIDLSDFVIWFCIIREAVGHWVHLIMLKYFPKDLILTPFW